MTFVEFEAWIDKNYRCYGPEQEAEFEKVLSLLPKPCECTDTGAPVPCGCGPHSYMAMHLFLEVAKPKRLLEIGFNVGRSATFWLSNGVKSLTSLELRSSKEVSDSELSVQSTARVENAEFSIVYGDSKTADKKFKAGEFDAAFIDGGHEYNDVIGDIAMCRRLGIKKLFFDDWITAYGGVMKAVHDTGLKIVFTSGSMVYCLDEYFPNYWP